jgi:putative N6-adenine-specific DNA methylase
LLGHDAVRTNGGVSFAADLATVYETNLMHRTANRILIRLGQFLAQSYPMLYDRTRRLPWEIFLGTCQDVEFKVAFSESRLRNKDHIQNVVSNAIQARRGSLGIDTGLPSSRRITIYVRLHRDRCTLSLDSSGTHLHKRGYRLEGVAAPIRETTAAGILQIAGARNYHVVVDPFCGSGTFCIEADMLFRNAAPGLSRSFAIEDTPLHSAGTFAQARRNAVSNESRADGVRIVGTDIDAQAIRAASTGAARAACSRNVRFHQADALELDLGDLKGSHERGLIVANLPYGKRLLSSTGANELLKRFNSKLSAAAHGWDFVLVTTNPELFIGPRLLIRDRLDFTNGGLDAAALFGSVL